MRLSWGFVLVAAFIAAGFSAVGGHAFAADGNGSVAESDFSIVILPDTQNYAESFPQTYIAQTEWIKRERKPLDIRFVIHLGDIVQNPTVEKEWRVADRAHAVLDGAVLDGAVPYSVLPGNHDMKGRDTTLYNKFFPPKRFQNRDWYGGHEGQTNNNNYCTFEASGLKFLVLSLEYAPGQKTLDWANRVVAEHAGHRVIVATHSYLNTKGRNPLGKHIWDRLVRKHKNIFIVVCGHIIGTNLLEATGDADEKVHEMLVDYQGEPNGGDGWLRILRFSPQADKIFVRDYSPTLGKYRDGPAANFSLDYRMSAAAK
jgi:3',5'-cyclic AMP phosphodiesterase CpdA